jgi:hypothetical protein
MTDQPQRRSTSWVDDVIGGIRSVGIEALVVLTLALVAFLLAWVVVTVV